MRRVTCNLIKQSQMNSSSGKKLYTYYQEGFIIQILLNQFFIKLKYKALIVQQKITMGSFLSPKETQTNLQLPKFQKVLVKRKFLQNQLQKYTTLTQHQKQKIEQKMNSRYLKYLGKDKLQKEREKYETQILSSKLPQKQKWEKRLNQFQKETSNNCHYFCQDLPSNAFQIMFGEFMWDCKSKDVFLYLCLLQQAKQIQLLKQQVYGQENSGKCKICLDTDATHCNMSCGHLCVCQKDAKKLLACPLCRTKGQFRRIYSSHIKSN